MKKIGILFLAAVTAFTSYAPAQAMPAVPLSQANDVDLVRHRERWHGHRPRPRPGWHHGGYRPRPGWRGEGYRYSWYNGHRGYRYHRHGYRRHNDGWWYPLAAFGAGAIIGGTIAAPPRYAEPGLSQRHTNWCYNRYRSYRAWDNSFQPYGGPRQQCYSPYY
ncbi:BA14K family protein [Sinorhizobium numidicum]|uniref:Lectin-like protein BA14k n=1 Tax=Sinorhizobium numidicum TaxID=680248 RepID=A0ABY8CVU4_9HYPH|nr:BA14K family protein [Sinorhizobium numidicum]WEX76099.1 BA14K family protein [Sinorhizobium numidicum]WEX82758.1 BA14K family protein [Sinorhizobium numidicum]